MKCPRTRCVHREIYTPPGRPRPHHTQLQPDAICRELWRAQGVPAEPAADSILLHGPHSVVLLLSALCEPSQPSPPRLRGNVSCGPEPRSRHLRKPVVWRSQTLVCVGGVKSPSQLVVFVLTDSMEPPVNELATPCSGKPDRNLARDVGGGSGTCRRSATTLRRCW